MGENTPVMDISKIRSILPHAYPFLLIDKVTEFEEGPNEGSFAGRKVTCIKNVTINEPFFQGHFPHRPVMPGVLVVESMAQASAICCYREGQPAMDVAFAGIRDAKFRRPIVPGDTIELRTEILKDRGGILLSRAEAWVEGKKAAEAEILAKIFPLQ